MLRFHALLFARPADEAVAVAPVELAGRSWPGLAVSEADLRLGWRQSWEETMARMEQLPRLYPEPDGSFVWATPEGKLSGVLYDREGRMCYAELFGECSWETVEAFLGACGAPAERFVFQLSAEGVNFDDSTFKEFLISRAL